MANILSMSAYVSHLVANNLSMSSYVSHLVANNLSVSAYVRPDAVVFAALT